MTLAAAMVWRQSTSPRGSIPQGSHPRRPHQAVLSRSGVPKLPAKWTSGRSAPPRARATTSRARASAAAAATLTTSKGFCDVFIRKGERKVKRKVKRKPKGQSNFDGTESDVVVTVGNLILKRAQGSPKSKDVVKAFTWMDIAWTTAARVGGADATVGTELEEVHALFKRGANQMARRADPPVKSPTKCAPILAATKRQLLATTATNTAIRNQLLRANRKEDISASPINAKKGRWSNVAIKTKMMASMHDDEEEEEDRTQTALGQRLAKYSADSSSQLPDGASIADQLVL
ncbi:hypothetical protein THAOC_20460 [Thalassiosira oceanica]|uniref:Uncharacterized protein n=1 Tax=Thalassiosira oceanica TaxID=159749 RepID=K0S3B9_THAOC|nr:hypothetical protein THAOC_20460 [Thalassiosira oceanica]|eukprot:EJK59334.1 hypothetical protein THAOC_20460 [Thalassiosira oceanica]